MWAWFGHIERMEGERLMKKIYQAEMEGNRLTGEVDQGEGDEWSERLCE